MNEPARNADWLLIADALERMLVHAATLGSEHVPLDACCGRTLAEAVISPIDQPPWDNSAMDGFAVRAADVRGASGDAPVRLRVVDDIPAGAIPTRAIGAGEAARIMTGAPVPSGADGVIRIEHTRAASTGVVEIVSDADAGRNVRFRAEDLAAGAGVFTTGRLLRPAEIGVLAMIGHTHPRVTRRPCVALLATGDELVPPERLDAVRAGTHIINSNSPALTAALHETGCEALPLGIARDDLGELRTCIARALDADALITTAGASVGDHDLVKDALEEAGCRTQFWRVKIRPGSPFSYGLLPRDGRPPLPVFGLPGNPVSALVTFEVLVRPVLRRMLGRRAVHARVMRVRAGEDIRSPAGLVRFLRVRLADHEDAIPRAYLTGPQGSGILTSVAAADALLVVPLDVDRVPAGALLRAVPLGGDRAQEVSGL